MNSKNESKLSQIISVNSINKNRRENSLAFSFTEKQSKITENFQKIKDENILNNNNIKRKEVKRLTANIRNNINIQININSPKFVKKLTINNNIFNFGQGNRDNSFLSKSKVSKFKQRDSKVLKASKYSRNRSKFNTVSRPKECDFFSVIESLKKVSKRRNNWRKLSNLIRSLKFFKNIPTTYLGNLSEVDKDLKNFKEKNFDKVNTLKSIKRRFQDFEILYSQPLNSFKKQFKNSVYSKSINSLNYNQNGNILEEKRDKRLVLKQTRLSFDKPLKLNSIDQEEKNIDKKNLTLEQNNIFIHNDKFNIKILIENIRIEAFNLIEKPEKNLIEKFQYLINKLKQLGNLPGPNFEFNKKNDKGKTLLYIACREGLTEVVEFLIKNGVDPKIKSIKIGNEYETSLQVAIRWNYFNIVKILLEKVNFSNEELMECCSIENINEKIMDCINKKCTNFKSKYLQTYVKTNKTKIICSFCIVF